MKVSKISDLNSVGTTHSIQNGRGHYGKFRKIISRTYDDNKNLHSNNGPAVIWDDFTNEWYRHGLLSRLDGPAVSEYYTIFEIAKVRQYWCIQNFLVNEEEYKQWLTDNGMDIKNLSDADRDFIYLYFDNL